MTVASTDNSVNYAGDGVATVWPFSFPILDATHLAVTLVLIADGTIENISSSLYTISGLGVASGGSITYPLVGPPVPVTKRIYLVRTVPYKQEVAINNQGGFLPEVVEEGLDLLEMQVQQLKALVETVQSSVIAAGNVPSPAIGDVNKFIRATGLGVFGWVTLLASMVNDSTTVGRALMTAANAAAGRTALALGSAALLTAGVAAGNAIALDGSAKLPAVDGSQLTNLPVTSTWANGSINGLTISRATATTFGIAIGTCRNEDGGTAYNLTLASAFTKALTAWAVGTGNGGIDTGAVANTTWYHVHLIRKDSDGSIDVLYSLSATAPTMPGGYTARRRIGSFKTNGSAQIIAFSQVGDEFLWDAAVVDIDSTNPGTSAVTRTLNGVPTGIQVIAVGSAGVYGGTNAIIAYLFSSLDISDQAPQTPGTAALSGFTSGTTAITSTWFLTDFRIRTNTSGQIRSRIHLSGAADHVGVITRGWIDTRGK